MRLNSLSDLLKGFKAHKPSVPKPRTPAPERNKVVSKTPRDPINKQAALLISPMRSWIFQPLPAETLPTRESKEIGELKADLKIERNEHARTRDELGASRLKLARVRLELEKLKEQNRLLTAKCQSQESTIQQLEDLRL